MNCDAATELIQLELDGDLGPGDRLVLNAHLATCAACTEARRQHLLIRGAVCDLAAERRECAPRCIPVPVRSTRRWKRSLAVAAVIALLVGAGLTGILLRRQAHQRFVQNPVAPHGAPVAHPPKQSASPAIPTVARPVVRVEFDDESSVIAVPVPTSNPNVTIMWLYPTLHTAEAETETSDVDTPS